MYIYDISSLRVNCVGRQVYIRVQRQSCQFMGAQHMWQKASPVTMGWFAGPTWKNNKWYT